MRAETALKWGQVVGVLLLAAGVAECSMNRIEHTPMLMLLGGLVYGGCRITAWMRAK